MRAGKASVDTQKMVSQRQLLRTQTGVGCMFRITLQLTHVKTKSLLMPSSGSKCEEGKCRLGKRSGHKPLFSRRSPEEEYLGLKRLLREAAVIG